MGSTTYYKIAVEPWLHCTASMAPIDKSKEEDPVIITDNNCVL